MEGLSQDTSRFSHRNSHSRRRARVDIVPLIDVMFLLVAFFMLLSISMVFQKGISVDLSVSGTSETNSEQLEPLVISITSLGEYFLGENRISREELKIRLKLEPSDRVISIQADRKSRHQSLIDLLDLIRQADLHSIVFAVEPKT